MITKVEAHSENKNRKFKNICSQFFQRHFQVPNSKSEQIDTSAVAAATTMNAPVLSTVSEIARWYINCCGPTMADLHHIHTYIHTHIYIYIHKYTHIHTYIHT